MVSNPNREVTALRQKWETWALALATPLFTNFREMPYVVGGNQDRRISTHIEAFGRTLAGIAPWLSTGNRSPEMATLIDNIAETLKEFFAPNPQVNRQWLIDYGYLCLAFLRAPHLFNCLDGVTQGKILGMRNRLAHLIPIDNNWIVMKAVPELFMRSKQEHWDRAAVRSMFQRVNSWYLGDGMYADGRLHASDYYNSYVFNPVLVDLALQLETWTDSEILNTEDKNVIFLRAKQYATYQERLISPEGTIPVFGRSITYRCGAMHALSHAIWRGNIEGKLVNGALHGLTAVAGRFFDSMYKHYPNSSHKWPSIGYMEEQLDLAEPYISVGSMYAAALVFPLLGTNPQEVMWHDKPKDWTAKKLYQGHTAARYVALGSQEPGFAL